MTDFLDPHAARALFCERGLHVVYHPTTPFMCPYPGCGGKTFSLASAADENAHKTKGAAFRATTERYER